MMNKHKEQSWKYNTHQSPKKYSGSSNDYGGGGSEKRIEDKK